MHDTVIVRNAAGLFMFKWFILWVVNFTLNLKKKVVGEGVRVETGRRLLQNLVHKTELGALGGGKPERWTHPPHTVGGRRSFHGLSNGFLWPKCGQYQGLGPR